MKRFTIFSTILLVLLSFSCLMAQRSQSSDYKKLHVKKASTDLVPASEKSNTERYKDGRVGDYTNATEDTWDLLFMFVSEDVVGVPSSAGIESDGNYFYLAKWNGSEIHKVDMDGNYIETFTISGVSGLRDLAFDGTYFYGGAASNVIYEMDFDSKTLVSTITAPSSVGVRAIAYDNENDGFWVNNWDTDLTFVNRDGTTGTTYSGITSQYGMAYDNVTDGGPFIWCFTGTTGGEDMPAYLEQFSLSTGTYTGVTHSTFDDMGSSLAGGLCTYEADGLFVIAGVNQGYEDDLGNIVEPNRFFGYELATLVQYDTDASLASFVSPVTGYDLTASEVVEVVVKNKGTSAISNFEVSYSVDGGADVTETHTGSIAAGEEASHTFATPANLSAFGDYSITATVTLTGDENDANDSKTTSVNNSPAPLQITAYPMNVDYWTGSTDGVTKTQVSLIDATGDDVSAGWMTFDLSDLPAGAEINWAELHVYVNDTNYPYWSVTPMSVDPLTADAASIWNDIAAGTATTDAYAYNNEASTFAAGWHTYALSNSAPDDIAAAAGNTISMGAFERDSSPDYYLVMDGQAQTNMPYLVIDYNEPVSGDAGIETFTMPASMAPGTITPSAVVKNYSGDAMSFPVTLTISDGYTSTMQVTNLAAGQSTTVTFDEWTAEIGDYTAEVCAEAAGDPNSSNNCASVEVSVDDLTQAYMYVAYDPTSNIPEGPASFFLETPGSVNSLAATTSSEFISAGAWADGVWYGYEYYDADLGSGGDLYTIDPVTGAMTSEGNIGLGLNGIAYDYSTNTMFAIGSGSLYEIDLDAVSASMIGALGSTQTFINLACDADGNLYSMALDDILYSINKETGAATAIGSVGFDASYAQDAEFDVTTNTLYLAAYNVTLSAGELRIADVNTGNTTLVGAFENGMEVCGFAIPGSANPGPSGPLYTINVGVSTNTNRASNELIMGVDPSATDGLDEELGEYELPPLPPAGAFDARLILPESTIGSEVDYRYGTNDINETIIYRIQWQIDENATEVTLNLNVPVVEGNVVVTVTDVLGGATLNETINEGTGQITITNMAITAVNVSVNYVGPLPVELTGFAANVVGESIQLNWSTATETNNKGFEIERSQDQTNYTKVGYVDGFGTTTEPHTYTFTDQHATSGTYYYRLKQIDLDGTAHYSEAIEVEFMPTAYSLGQNYPNPFNPSTTIKFALPVESKVTVTLYNMLGEKVREIISGQFSAGLQEVKLNASDLASGMYIYNISATGTDGSNFVDTKKMMLMK